MSAPTSTNPSFTAAAPARATSAPTILVVEDYSDTREFLATLLQSHGYNVVEAEDGIEGILKAAWLYPDLILMDLSLPEMDGVEAVARIHGQTKLSRIPIFAVSAYLTKAVEQDVREAGCVEVVAKPFEAKVLLEKIRQALTPTETP